MPRSCFPVYHSLAQERIRVLSPTDKDAIEALVRTLRSDPQSGQALAARNGKVWYQGWAEGEWIQTVPDTLSDDAQPVARRLLRVIYDWLEEDADCLLRIVIVETSQEATRNSDAHIREKLDLGTPPPLDLDAIPAA